MSNVFGLLVAGRLVQTDCQQVDDKHFLFTVAQVSSINHIVVFLTGNLPFPAGMGGGVYFARVSSQGPSWQLLGFLSNEKPSAIFKIGKLKAVDDKTELKPMLGFATNHVLNTAQDADVAQIGISVESLDSLKMQTPAENVTPSALTYQVEFTQKMLESFYNFSSSFSLSQEQMMAEPGKQFVPLDVLQKWYENFSRRLEQNVNFWKS